MAICRFFMAMKTRELEIKVSGYKFMAMTFDFIGFMAMKIWKLNFHGHDIHI